MHWNRNPKIEMRSDSLSEILKLVKPLSFVVSLRIDLFERLEHLERLETIW